MTSLKRIAAYQTTDGRTFDDKDAAKKHQTELDRKHTVVELVKKGMGADEGGKLSEELTASDVAQFILDNAIALREILPKRAKSVKAEEPAKPETEQGTAANVAVVQPAIETCEQLPAAAEAAEVEKQSPASEFAWPAGLSANLNQTQAAA